MRLIASGAVVAGLVVMGGCGATTRRTVPPVCKTGEVMIDAAARRNGAFRPSVREFAFGAFSIRARVAQKCSLPLDGIVFEFIPGGAARVEWRSGTPGHANFIGLGSGSSPWLTFKLEWDNWCALDDHPRARRLPNRLRVRFGDGPVVLMPVKHGPRCAEPGRPSVVVIRELA